MQIHVPGTASREEWHCPECGGAVPVDGSNQDTQPAVSEDGDTYSIRKPEPEKRKRRKVNQTYVPNRDVPDEAIDRRTEAPLDPMSASQLEGPLGLQRRERLKVQTDPPPEKPFVTNVFGFPYDGSVISHWLIVAGGYTFFAFLGLVIYSMLLAAASMASAVMAFIALPAFWIGCWTFSFAAACFLVVIEETAAGNNSIREWMDNTWRDWMAQLFYVLYIACIPMAIAWPIVGLTGHTVSEVMLPLAVVEFIVFPIALLSALELDSPWFPFSGPILTSMFKVFGGWVKFYALSAVVAALCGGLVYFVLKEAAFAGALLLGPLFAWATFVYARLIGRLGWLITRRVRVRERSSMTEREIPPERDAKTA